MSKDDIPVIIFCGGKATRFNNGKPGPLKPLIKVNGITMLERIMSLFYTKGFNNFILLSGYKHRKLHNYFKLKKKSKINVKIYFTGVNSSTAERLFKVKHLIKNFFFLTYGDSLTNFNPVKALKKKNNNNMIVSVYKKKINYGVFKTKENKIKNIYQKNFFANINAGFYVGDKKIFKYLKSKSKNLEGSVLNNFIKKYNLEANYVSKWHPMDDIQDKIFIEKILKKDTKFFEN